MSCVEARCCRDRPPQPRAAARGRRAGRGRWAHGDRPRGRADPRRARVASGRAAQTRRAAPNPGGTDDVHEHPDSRPGRPRFHLKRRPETVHPAHVSSSLFEQSSRRPSVGVVLIYRDRVREASRRSPHPWNGHAACPPESLNSQANRVSAHPTGGQRLPVRLDRACRTAAACPAGREQQPRPRPRPRRHRLREGVARC